MKRLAPLLLLALAACESKADKYLRLRHEVAEESALVTNLLWQRDTLDAATRRAALTDAERQRAARLRDSVTSAALVLSTKVEHAQAELAVLR